MNVRRLALSTSLALGLLGSNAAYALQGATPVASPGMGQPGVPEGCVVVADGLVNPRYVAVDDDGVIYISEAGTGGDEMVSPPAASPEPSASPVTDEPAPDMGEMPPIMRGNTGQVTMVTPDGEQSVLVDGLPSYMVGGLEITGPAGLVISNDAILLAVGGSGPATAFSEPLEYENTIVSIDPQSGSVTMLADLGVVERGTNPDPYNIDSNLYGIDVGEDGYIYVNDAGGNTTFRVPNGGGEVELVAIHPGIEIPEGDAPPGGNPGRGGELALDPVPTDIVTGADGSMLVGLLSGGPFPAGAAKVVSVAPDGTITDLATGLTMVVGLAVGPDGHLYASQLSMNLMGEMPEPGNVVRVLEDGTHEVVLDGLMLPNGMTFDQDGNMLVVVNTVSIGGPTGQLLRCEGVAMMQQAPEVVTISLDDMFYSPSSITIPADTDVTVRLVNDGVVAHDISISGVGIRSERIQAGEEVEMVLNLPAGNYAFGCDVPGHRLAGMTGVVRVE